METEPDRTLDTFSGLGLYYPTLHFSDPVWLRRAFLTWQHLARIGDRRYIYGDSAEVELLRRETDFLSEAAPSDEELWLVGDAFAQLVVEHGKLLREHYAIIDRDGTLSKEIRSGGQEADPWSNILQHVPTPSNRLSYIYVSDAGKPAKMSELLEGTLYEERLGFRLRYASRCFIGVHPRVGWVYMSALAHLMASRRRYDAVTDNETAHRVSGDASVSEFARGLLRIDRREPRASDPTTMYLHIAIDDVIPANLGGISIDRLIRFRDRRSDELSGFHKHVQGLSPLLATVADVSDERALLEHVRVIYQRETRPLISNLRRAMTSDGFDTVGTALTVKIDATALAGTAIGTVSVATGASPIMTAAGIAAAVVPTVVSAYRERRRKRTESPVAYLISARAGRSQPVEAIELARRSVETSAGVR